MLDVEELRKEKTSLEDVTSIVPFLSSQMETNLLRCLYLTALLGFYVTMISINSFNVLIYPLVFIPTVLIYCVYLYQCHKGHIDSSMIPSTMLESSYMLLLLYLIPHILLNYTIDILLDKLENKLTHLTGFEQSLPIMNPWQHSVVFLTSFVFAATIEEFEKGLAILFCIQTWIKQPTALKNAQSYLWIGSMVGLGFGTFEGILYACFNSEGTWNQIESLSLRVCLCIPLHALWGLAWAIGFARRTLLNTPENRKSWWMAGLVPWLAHGVYDLVLFELYLLAETYPCFTRIGNAIGMWMGVMFTLYSIKSYLNLKKDISEHQSKIMDNLDFVEMQSIDEKQVIDPP